MFNLKEFSKTFLLAIACVAMCGTVSAQDQTRFLLKLDNDLISSFRSHRSLRSNVPAEFQGKISFVELQFAETKDKEPITLNPVMAIFGETANITLTDEMIESVKAQPVRVAVAGDARTFSQIVLLYDTPVATDTTINKTGPGVDMYFIRLGDNQTMSGTMEGFESFEIKTSFGLVTIPMDQVAGIKFHVDSEDAAVVVLNNGDSITGMPAIPLIKLITDWGQADIEPKAIKALTTNSAAEFTQENNDFGKRWVLKTGGPLAPTARSARNIKN